ncbi:MAG TPA: hypothetical protein ENN17_07240 [bacterium]|nr:hypothetical protein [bacterium]
MPGKRNQYILIASGFHRPLFRDFATSPLFYQGIGMSMAGGGLFRSPKRDHLIEIEFTANQLKDHPPKSRYFQPSAEAYLLGFNGYYHYLRKIDRFSSGRTQIRFGGGVEATQNIRINAGLGNAVAGFETLFHVLAVGNVTRDISRTESKSFRFLFFKKEFRPVKRDLTFTMHTGILNFNRRPGYTFVDVLEIDASDLEWISPGYRWSLNGWRLGARIEFVVYRPNGNAVKWAYLWNAVHAPGKFEPFQMASHQIRYTMMFNNNKD